MTRRPGLMLKLTAGFFAVVAVTFAAVLFAIEQVTTESFGVYVDHVEEMGRMMSSVDIGAAPGATEFTERLRWSLVLAGLGGALTATLLGVIVARRITGPLRSLQLAAHRVAGGDLSVRVPVKSDDEIGDLGASFNAMADSLAAQGEARKEFLADVAHELRTPLTILQGEIETLQDGLVEPSEVRFASLYEETLLLARIVEDLRTLSLLDAGELHLSIAAEPVIALLERSAGSVRQGAMRAGVDVVVEAGDGLPPVAADRERVAQVLMNLLSNALRHTPAGGTVTLRAAVDEESAMVRVAVDDTGPGIPPHALPHIWDRFYRADASRSRGRGGSGLGLSIVQQLVRAHRGEAWAANRPQGGASIGFSLPVATGAPRNRDALAGEAVAFVAQQPAVGAAASEGSPVGSISPIEGQG